MGFPRQKTGWRRMENKYRNKLKTSSLQNSSNLPISIPHPHVTYLFALCSCNWFIFSLENIQLLPTSRNTYPHHHPRKIFPDDHPYPLHIFIEYAAKKKTANIVYRIPKTSPQRYSTLIPGTYGCDETSLSPVIIVCGRVDLKTGDYLDGRDLTKKNLSTQRAFSSWWKGKSERFEE